MRSKNILLLLSTSLLTSTLYASESDEIEVLKAQIQELQEKTDILIEETSNLQTGFNYSKVEVEKSHSGLGAAASKVYYSKSPLSIGGYGEMYHATQSNGDSKIDVYRFVPYIGYKFSDNIILNTEIEFEHGGLNSSGDGGEVIIEFLTLDFLLNSYANIRVGHMLVPMGLINERHEPTLFTTVQRPGTSKYLIPSTWHESGVMVYGYIIEGLEYKLGLISALKTGTDGDKWIRGGRNGSFANENPNLAYIARLDYTAQAGLLIGGSFYTALADDASDASMTMYDIHADYHLGGFRAYGTYSATTRSEDKEALNYAPTNVSSAHGGYLNLSYDALSLTSSTYSLPLFIQHESINTQAELYDGTKGDPLNSTTVGINFFPHEQVVLKADYAIIDDTSSERVDYIASFGLGFIF